MRGLPRRKGQHRKPVTSHRARKPRPHLAYIVFLATIASAAALVWLYVL